ncbi:MAG: energy-coupling factor transporter ATPase [Clostridia bacterium]|nr:energy-coupling factor transporter ATPase [Clostridia bacterium]
MNETIIKAEKLGYTYEGDERNVRALDGVDIEIYRGEFLCVLGQNGSGKSTLAKLFNLILTPTDGVLELFGKRIEKDITDDEIFDIRRKIGMVFQNPDNQLVATIVEEDVAFGPENIGMPPAKIRETVDAALDTVGMSEYARHSPHQLSGGQKQRVAIAGIIALSPDVIIFDESTAMLDPNGRAEVMDTIKKLKNSGTTVVLITHYMEEAAEADRVAVIDGGRKVLEGTPTEVFTEREKLIECGLAVPQATELMLKLKQKGFVDTADVLTPYEAALAIAKAAGGAR